MSPPAPADASPSRSTPSRLGDAAVGYVIAIVSASLAVGSLQAISPAAADGATAVVVSSGAMWIGFIGVPLWASARRGTGDLGADFGLRARWTDLIIGLPAGVATQLLLLPLIYAALGRFVDTSSISDPAQETLGRGSGVGLVAIVIVVGLGAPIAEEIFFRGLFQRAAQNRWGQLAGLIAVAAVFGATHFQPLQFPGLFAAGLVFGLLAWRASRLGPAIFAHIGFNMTAVMALILA